MKPDSTDNDRQLAPFSFDPQGRDRWALIVPQRIATECSPRHVQSVIEDAQAAIALAIKALRTTGTTALHALAAIPQDDPDADRSPWLALRGSLAGAAMQAMAALSQLTGKRQEADLLNGHEAKLVEAISWHRVGVSGQRVPPVAVDLWLTYADGRPAFWGAYLVDGWVGPEGEALERAPLYWAEPARGPFQPARDTQGGAL